MHESLTAIKTELNQTIARLNEYPSDEPFGIIHKNWSLPCLTKKELIDEARSIINFIDDHEYDEFDDTISQVTDYVDRLKHIHKMTIPKLWGNEAAVVIAYHATLEGLRKTLNSLIPEEDPSEIQKRVRKLGTHVGNMEVDLNGLMPRIESIKTHMARIEEASSAAEQLTAYLDEISQARERVFKLVHEAEKDQDRVKYVKEAVNEHEKNVKEVVNEHEKNVKEAVNEHEKNIKTILKKAQKALDRSEEAYSAATSVGLAAAFSERSEELKKSMWFWIASLIVALLSGIFISWNQLQELSKLFEVETNNPTVIALNLVVTILSVGAPVWFAWLATKQIGQRFRLSEDYAFKASTSRTYESYRREASRVDKDMETKLLDSALTRLDELPLRLVESQSYGSPWHELASSPVVKKAMKIVPDFPEQVIQLARKIINTDKSPKNKSTQSNQSEPKTEG